MVYTPIMYVELRINRNFLLISLGLILIIAGLAGNIVTFIKSDVPKLTGAFRYVEKIETGNANAAVLASNVGVSVIENVFSKNSLDKQAYFIHPTHDKSLEIPLIPDKIEIPAIGLVAPIQIAEFNFTDIEGETFGQWVPAAAFAAAWHPNSALLGEKGNTVINGHHNMYGEVFGKLIDLESGDIIYVYAKGKRYPFVVANKMILLERGQPLEVRMENAEWLGKTDDERLTLVTCWPQKTNTHRLIIVARPY